QQHFLNFFPLPQKQGSFLPGRLSPITVFSFSPARYFSKTSSCTQAPSAHNASSNGSVLSLASIAIRREAEVRWRYFSRFTLNTACRFNSLDGKPRDAMIVTARSPSLT